jgi:hypothetical protein
MTALLMLVTALCVLTRADTSPATTIRLHIVYYEGGIDPLPVEDAYETVKYVTSFYQKQFNIRLVHQTFEVRDFSEILCEKLSDFYNYACWVAIKHATSDVRRRRVLTLAIIPPMIKGDFYFMAGEGTLLSFRQSRGLAMAYCGEVAAENLDRKPACLAVSAHELAHNLGALHCDKGSHGCSRPNFMRSNGLDYVSLFSYNLVVANPTKKQIRDYLKFAHATYF